MKGVGLDLSFRAVLAQVSGVLAVGILLLSHSGCNPAKTAETASSDRPLTLRLGYTPSEEPEGDRREAFVAMAGYLQRSVGVRIELVRTGSYEPAVTALERGEIDLITLPPFAYILAARKGVAEAFVATGHRETGPRTYRSVLITNRKTGPATLEEALVRKGELRFNLADPASNSGHLVPRAFLANQGMDIERDCASFKFTRSHSVAIFNVVFGKADLAGVNHSTLQRLIARQKIDGDDVRILWLSDPLPNGPLAIRPGIPREFKDELQAALLALHEREPETWKIVMRQYSDPSLVYLPCNDTLYDGLRKLAREAELRAEP